MGDLRGKRAVITGASAGLGAAMARQLASRGCDLVITARRADRLEDIAEPLRRELGVAVTCVALDLTERDARQQLVEAAYAGGEVDLVINNAGFGEYGAFDEVDWNRYEQLLSLNIGAVVELTHRFAARMQARADRARCRIANVSSVLAWFAVPRFGVYAASRSFVRNFSESAAMDLRGTNVSVTCVCFGGTYTEFNEVAGIQPSRLYRLVLSRPEDAVRKAIKGILRGRRVVVTGWYNRAATWLTKILPRRLMSWSMKTLLGTPRRELPEGS